MIFYCLIGVESRSIYDYSVDFYDMEDSAIDLISLDYYYDDLDEDLTIIRVDSPYCASDPYFLEYLKEAAIKAEILK